MAKNQLLIFFIKLSKFTRNINNLYNSTQKHVLSTFLNELLYIIIHKTIYAIQF